MEAKGKPLRRRLVVLKQMHNPRTILFGQRKDDGKETIAGEDHEAPPPRVLRQSLSGRDSIALYEWTIK